MTDTTNITVFYDGKCSLCAREIRYYQRIAPSDAFHWIDVTESENKLTEHELDLVSTLKYLHAMDSNGQMHIGADAFILMWSALRHWRWLAKLISLPPFYQIAKLCYTYFAKQRFKRLTHCQAALDASVLNSTSADLETFNKTRPHH